MSGRRGPALLLAGSAALLAVLCLLSLLLGSRDVPLGQTLRALTGQPVDALVANVIWSVRVPRTLLALLTGAALGVSGALMQALTRNPLADPGILGVSAGASFAIVSSIALLGVTSMFGYIWFAFAGAFAASLLVYLLGGLGPGGPSPVRLALAGVAVTSLLFSLSSALVLTDPQALNRYRFWSAGSLAGHGGDTVLRILPFLAVGMVLALACAPALNSLALGDDVAVALGRRVGLVRLQGVAAIMLLTGAAVAVIGPVVFLGLVVPHAARALAQRFGHSADHRLLLPLSAVLAPGLLIVADLAGRLIARPVEIQSGVLIAFIGGPFFIALVRRRRLAEV